MGRLINAISGKKDVLVLGKCQDRNVVVAGWPTQTLRTLLSARYLWARLARRSCAALEAWRHGRAMPLALGATGATQPRGSVVLTCMRGRRSRPGHPFGRGRF